MDFDSLQEDEPSRAPASLPAAAAPAAAPLKFDDLKDDNADAAPKFDDLEDDSDKYGSATQQLITGAEGLAKGVAGPLATLAETKLLGIPEADIIGREEANPWIHGGAEAAGFVGSLFTGVGEAALIGKAGEAVAGAAKLGKVGSTVLKGAIDSGLFQAGDEVDKYILGQSDPEAPVSSALAHIGGATLLGGGIGGAGGMIGNKLAQIAEGKTASKASKFLADLGNRFEFLTKNKNIPAAATEEAAALHEAVQAAGHSGYTLKDQAIQKLVPEAVTPEISSQNENIAKLLTDKHKEMISNPDVFTKSQANEFSKNVNKWMEVTTNPESSTHEIFNATQDLKQAFQYNAEYNLPPVSKHDAKFPILQAYRDLAPQLRTALEDKNIWGGAAELQQGINSAYSKLQKYQKDFLQSFSTKKLGEATIDPTKIQTMLNQVGKGKGALRGSKLADYLEPAKKFLQEIDDLHASLGVESSIPNISTNVLDEMLNGTKSSGSKLADWMFGAGPKSIGMAGAHAVGSAAGAMVGGPMGGVIGYKAGEHIAPILEEGLGRKLTRSAVSGVLKALSTGEHEGIPQAINYAESISKGAKKIDDSVNNLFIIGGQKALNQDYSEKDREKLEKYIESGTFNQEVQNQLLQGQPKRKAPPAAFAHGGEVMAPQPAQPVSKPVPTVLGGMSSISKTFPEQAMLLGAAKGRINTYLNSVRPEATQSKLPFDDDMKDASKKRSYKKALDIANKPLSIMDHIKQGTLDVEQVQHMNGLYPELADHLRKKITDKIVKAQLANEKPSYKVRQAMSLFMGSPLDSSMTPQNILAAQAVFASKKGQQPGSQGAAKKGSTKTLENYSQPYHTADQARQMRGNRLK